MGCPSSDCRFLNDECVGPPLFITTFFYALWVWVLVGWYQEGGLYFKLCNYYRMHLTSKYTFLRSYGALYKQPLLNLFVTKIKRVTTCTCTCIFLFSQTEIQIIWWLRYVYIPYQSTTPEYIWTRYSETMGQGALFHIPRKGEG